MSYCDYDSDYVDDADSAIAGFVSSVVVGTGKTVGLVGDEVVVEAAAEVAEQADPADGIFEKAESKQT